VLDEVQKLPNWTEVITRLGHWRFAEMKAAFDYTLDEFIYYGGYPGAASLMGEPVRWAAYVRDALIETTISKDVLMMSPVQKPALLLRLFDLACRYSAQELSYQKMLGQLSDAGNTTTLAQLRATPELRGRFTESAVGAELLARKLTHSSPQPCIHYWRDGSNEVDFVLRQQGDLFAFEVKSGINQGNGRGLDAFCKLNPACRPLVLGTGGLALQSWFEGQD
jgi:predicted AAA+ superfamily ATPase